MTHLAIELGFINHLASLLVCILPDVEEATEVSHELVERKATLTLRFRCSLLCDNQGAPRTTLPRL